MVIEYTINEITTFLPMILPVLITFFFIEAALSLSIGLFLASKDKTKIWLIWGLTQILLILFIVIIYTVPSFTQTIINISKYIIT